MSRGDNRFKLPARDFSPNDLVLDIPPPPSRVYNPSHHPSNKKPSSHKDSNHFGRMRKWLIQNYSNVTWIFKEYDDFYPRDQALSPHDDADPPRVCVFVNDVYGLYEVAHWDNVEIQNSTSKKLLHLLGEAKLVNKVSSGGKVEKDILPFFRENQLPETRGLDKADGREDTEVALARNSTTPTIIIDMANPEEPSTSQDHSNLDKQTPIQVAAESFEACINAPYLPRVASDLRRLAPSPPPGLFIPANSQSTRVHARRLAPSPPPPGLFIPANSISTRVHTLAGGPSNRQWQAFAHHPMPRHTESPDPISAITTTAASPPNGPLPPPKKTPGKGSSKKRHNDKRAEKSSTEL
ncbi:hypothetical protein DV735_g3340, partial [Chaetothyriales sp. CBS 134920]